MALEVFPLRKPKVVVTALMSERQDESCGIGKTSTHGLRQSVEPNDSVVVTVNDTLQVGGRESRLNRPMWIISMGDSWVNL